MHSSTSYSRGPRLRSAVLAAILSIGLAFGQYPTIDQGIYLSTYVYQAALGDLDSDGDLDLVGVTPIENHVLLFQNLGSGLLAAPVTVFTCPTPFAIAIADMDSDGDADLIVTSSSQAWVLSNIGNLSFEASGSLPIGGFSLRVADFDGDRRPDPLLIRDSNQEIWLFRNTVTGLQGSIVASGLSSPQLPVAVDVDRDGDIDILVPEYGSNRIVILLNMGDGNFSQGATISGVAAPLHLSAGDIDGDGDIDILAANQAGGGGLVLCRDVSGQAQSYQVSILLHPSGYPSREVFLIDVDRDGDLDIVSLRETANRLDVSKNDGFGNFGLPVSLPFNQPLFLAIGDLDGEGTPDIVATTYSKGVFVLRNRTPQVSVSGGGFPGATMVLSGQPGSEFGASLAAVSGAPSDRSRHLVVGSPGDLQDRGRVECFAAELRWATSGVAPGDRFGVALAALPDIDGDGVQDLVVGAPGADLMGACSGSVAFLSGVDGHPLRVLIGDTGGDEFGFAVAYAGDWNGDGVADAAVSSPGHDLIGSDSGQVKIVSGADGTILYCAYGMAPGRRFGLALELVGDLDHDGRQDLLVSDRGDAVDRGCVSVLRGGVGNVLMSELGQGPNARFGQSLAGRNDLDGQVDLRERFAAVEPGQRVSGLPRGCVRLFNADGLASGVIDNDPIAPLPSFASRVAWLGDLDGDGVDDLGVGAPGLKSGTGAFRVFSGANGAPLESALFGGSLSTMAFGGDPVLGSRFGDRLAGLGDLDRDGHGDFVVAGPDQAMVRVMFSSSPVGLPLSGPAVGEARGILVAEQSDGNLARRVNLTINEAFALEVGQPATNPQPAPFAIGGFVGVPNASQAASLPFGLGSICIPSSILNPGYPGAFVLTNNYAPFTDQLVSSWPAPWTLMAVAPPVPFTVTLQGVITRAPGDLAVTNALILAFEI